MTVGLTMFAIPFLALLSQDRKRRSKTADSCCGLDSLRADRRYVLDR